ncbi:MAG: ABC transporter substrate-binding protein [Kiritimatiellia bacterium]
MKNLLVILAAVVVVALPFLFRRPPDAGTWRKGDPVLVAVSPHNEAIRLEFADAFSRWHHETYGQPVRIEWISIGGTTEIMRYLVSEYVGSAQAWWRREGHDWPPGATDRLLDDSFDPSTPPPGADGDALRRWEELRDLWTAFRATDDPAAASSRIDIFFGGGTYDHGVAARQGLVVNPWPDGAPAGLFEDEEGRVVIPRSLSGEVWRDDLYFGTVLSTFGICCNPDRLRDLGFDEGWLPQRWDDLADPRLRGHVGLTDPTKSGSVAKAFEMIVQYKCRAHMRAAGYDDATVARCEAAIAAAKLPPGEVPEGVPADYQREVEAGFFEGVNLLRRIGANARYFTDSASRVPIDVSGGSAAVGIAIDFYARFQAECSRAPDGTPRMVYVTPAGGSSVSADPISLLRGAPHRELAVRFIEFTLGREGQKLWNSRVGTPGGPTRFALRRLPIRRDFYPASGVPEWEAFADGIAANASDPVAAPSVNPYVIAEDFVYEPRWTGRHFGILRDLVRAMCLDSGDELRSSWAAIQKAGGPDANPDAIDAIERMPDQPIPFTWSSSITAYRKVPRMDRLREWTAFFRRQYGEAARLAKSKP